MFYFKKHSIGFICCIVGGPDVGFGSGVVQVLLYHMRPVTDGFARFLMICSPDVHQYLFLFW
jgi:hypothetical protein